jgi:hypothetical protein
MGAPGRKLEIKNAKLKIRRSNNTLTLPAPSKREG